MDDEEFVSTGLRTHHDADATACECRSGPYSKAACLDSEGRIRPTRSRLLGKGMSTTDVSSLTLWRIATHQAVPQALCVSVH